MRIFPCLLLFFFALLGAGCFESRTTIEVREDGSGILRGELLISERVMVAMEASGDSSSGMTANSEMVFDEATLRKQLGDEVTVRSLEVEDLEDGSRRIRFEVEAPDILAEINRSESPGLEGIRVVKLDADRGALEFDTRMVRGDMDLKLEQVYGLMKGMLVETTVVLPVPLEKYFPEEWGAVRVGERSVTQVLDLRDREGLDAMLANLEQTEGKRIRVTFPLSGWKPNVESIGSAYAESATGMLQEQGDEAEGLRAEVAMVSATRIRRLVEEETLDSVSFFNEDEEQLSVQVLVRWAEGARPVNFENPILEEVVTDDGKNLMEGVKESHRFRRDVNERQNAVVAAAEAPLPEGPVQTLILVRGVVPVVAGVEEENVWISDPASRVGKGKVDNEAFASVGGYVKSVDGGRIVLVSEGEAFQEFELVKQDGTRHGGSRSSWSGPDKQHTYTVNFPQGIEPSDAVEVRVRLRERVVRVPFEARNVPLP